MTFMSCSLARIRDSEGVGFFKQDTTEELVLTELRFSTQDSAEDSSKMVAGPMWSSMGVTVSQKVRNFSVFL